MIYNFINKPSGRDMEFSENYFKTINLYEKMHQNGTKKLSPDNIFAGFSLIKWIPEIKSIIKKTNAKSIIDFGCGKAMAYKQKIEFNSITYPNIKNFWNINEITLYDPGVPEFSNYPETPADGIICTDVIEHITPEDILKFIDELFLLSNKFLFLVIATKPASKYFEDGRNIHLTLKSHNEWNLIFEDFKKKYPSLNIEVRFNE